MTGSIIGVSDNCIEPVTFTLPLSTRCGRKRGRLDLVVVCISAFGFHAIGGEFINLDFESADLSGSSIEYRNESGDMPKPFGKFPFGTGSAYKLMPGWTIYDTDGNRESDRMAIGHGYFGQSYLETGSSRVSLLVPGDYSGFYGLTFMSWQPDGQFALAIDNRGSEIGDQRLHISQTGDVPHDAQWLTIR